MARLKAIAAGIAVAALLATRAYAGPHQDCLENPQFTQDLVRGVAACTIDLAAGGLRGVDGRLALARSPARTWIAGLTRRGEPDQSAKRISRSVPWAARDPLRRSVSAWTRRRRSSGVPVRRAPSMIWSKPVPA